MHNVTFSRLAALASGLIFGLGLCVSQMVDPAKVLGFLDVAGDWDPSLALVMAGAIPVAFVGFRIGRARHRPILAEHFSHPASRSIDARLLIGAVLFGAGWGLVGFCPGPALSALVVAPVPAAIFVIAMLAGMFLFNGWQAQRSR